MLDEWVQETLAALGLDPDTPVDVEAVLGIARDAAHAVSRPAAPLTTYLVGYAAAARGGGSAAFVDAAAAVERLVADRTPPEPDVVI